MAIIQTTVMESIHKHSPTGWILVDKTELQHVNQQYLSNKLPVPWNRKRKSLLLEVWLWVTKNIFITLLQQ